MRRGALIFAALALVVAFALTRGLVAQPGFTDAFYHFNAADRLARGDGLTDPYLWTYIGAPDHLPAPSHLYWMPLTSLLAAAGMALLGAPGTYAAAQLPFTLLFAGTALVGFWLGGKIGGGRRHAWVAGLLTLFSGYYTRFWGATDTFAPYALIGSLCLVALGLAVERLSDSRRAYSLCLAAGALAGLAHLTRADGLLLLGVGWVVIALTPSPSPGGRGGKEGLPAEGQGSAAGRPPGAQSAGLRGSVESRLKPAHRLWLSSSYDSSIQSTSITITSRLKPAFGHLSVAGGLSGLVRDSLVPVVRSVQPHPQPLSARGEGSPCAVPEALRVTYREAGGRSQQASRSRGRGSPSPRAERGIGGEVGRFGQAFSAPGGRAEPPSSSNKIESREGNKIGTRNGGNGRQRLLCLVLMTVAYLIVMAPWFIRNLNVIGAPLPIGGTQGIWFTEYNDLFAYPPRATAASFFAAGFQHVLATRWEALSNNLLRFVAEQGMIVLTPLMLVGLWVRRRAPFVRAFGLYALGLFAAMTFVFAYPGYRGGLFHSAAALVPWWAALGVAGLDTVVDWAAHRRRRWHAGTAKVVFSISLVVAALLLSLTTGLNGRVGAGTPPLYTRLKSVLPENARVMINDPAALYFFTGRGGGVLPNESPDVIPLIARQYGVGYLLLEAPSATPARLWPLFQTTPPFLTPIPLDTPNVRLYAITPP